MSRKILLISVSLMTVALAGTPANATVISISSSGKIEVQDTSNYLQKKNFDAPETSTTQQNTPSKNDRFNLLINPENSENTQLGNALKSEPVIARVIIPTEREGKQGAEFDAISEVETPDDTISIERIAIKQRTQSELIPPPSKLASTKLEKQKLFSIFVEIEAAKFEMIEPALIEAVIEAESNYNPAAVSPKGAMGLMQLMPATATQYSVVDAFNPADNIRAGTAELARLMKVYDNNLALALAGYNAGESAVKKYDGIPPYDETQEYVVKVLSKVLSKQAAALKTKKLEKPTEGEAPSKNEISRMKVYTFNFKP